MSFEDMSLKAQEFVKAIRISVDQSEFGNKSGKVDNDAESSRVETLLSEALSTGALDAADYLKLHNENTDEFVSEQATDKTGDKAGDKVENAAKQGVSDPLKVAESQQTEKTTKEENKANKEDIKAREQETKTYIKNSISNKDVTLTTMIAGWDGYFPSAYASEKAEIEAVKTAMGDYSTKEAIENLDQTVKKNLGKNITKLQKSVLNDMVTLANRDNIVKKAEELRDQYEEIKYQTNADGKTKTYTELYNEVAHQVKGSEYLNEAALVLKQYIKQNDAYDTYLQELKTIRQANTVMTSDNIIDELKNKFANNEEVSKELDSIQQEGKLKNNAEIISALETKFNNNEAVLNELKQIKEYAQLTTADSINSSLNKKYANDSLMLEVIEENKKVYRNTTKEGPADAVARGNKSDLRQVDLSHIKSRDELKELKNANKKLEIALWNYLQDNKNEDGTYNMDKLYEIVNDRSGYDYFSNKSHYLTLDEMHHIQEDMGYEKLHLNENDLKQLLEFMKRHYAKNTHYFSDAVGKTDYPKEAGEGFVTTLPCVTKNVVNASLNVNIKGFGEEAVKELTNAVINNGGKCTVSSNGMMSILITDIGWSGVVGAIAAPAAAILFTVLYNWAVGQAPDEMPCTNLADDLSQIKKECGDDPEKLKAYIAKRHSARATNSLSKLIDVYTKMNDNKFDTYKFVELITKMGGSGSLANCQELLGGYLNSEVPVIVEPDKSSDQDKDQNEKPEEYNLNIKPETKEEQVCYNEHIINNFRDPKNPDSQYGADTWSTLIHTYYEDTYKQYGWKKTLAALREALGTDASKNELPYLTRVNEKGKKENYLELPCELLGIKNHIGDLPASRQKYNTHNLASKVTKTPGVSYVGVKRSVSGFYAWDDNYKNGLPFWGETAEKAVMALEKDVFETTNLNRTYKNRDEQIKKFTPKK